MATTFKIGDIVQLRSGGPKMTVTRIDSLMEEVIHTTWFSGSKQESGAFPPETLIPVKDEQPK